jgi:hypothetical protein
MASGANDQRTSRRPRRPPQGRSSSSTPDFSEHPFARRERHRLVFPSRRTRNRARSLKAEWAAPQGQEIHPAGVDNRPHEHGTTRAVNVSDRLCWIAADNQLYRGWRSGSNIFRNDSPDFRRVLVLGPTCPRQSALGDVSLVEGGRATVGRKSRSLITTEVNLTEPTSRRFRLTVERDRRRQATRQHRLPSASRSRGL